MQLRGRGPIGGGCLAIIVFLFIEVILQYQMRGGHGYLVPVAELTENRGLACDCHKALLGFKLTALQL